MKAVTIALGASCAMLAACTPQAPTALSVQVGATGYGSADRLDPGQASNHSLDAEFPVAALKAKNLKEVRLELSFIPSQFREETLNFTVSIGGQ
jgi:hypothetical protein